MTGNRNFWRWAIGIQAGVCLILLLLNLLLPPDENGSRRNSQPSVGASGSASSHLNETAEIPRKLESSGPGRSVKSPASSGTSLEKRRIRPATKHRGERVGTEARPAEPVTLAQAPAPPDPIVTTLKPLGYVEKADGEVTAVIADGEYVRLVREGDLLAEGLRVVRISPRLVEAVEELPQRAAISVLPRMNSEPAEPPGRKPTTAPLPEAVATTKLADILPRHVEGLKSQRADEPPRRALPDRHPLETQAEVAVKPPVTSAIEARATAPPPPVLKTLKPIGYVERADGRVEAVVEDEDQVYLAWEGEVFADRYRAIRVSRSSVEVVDNLSAPLNQPPWTGGGLKAGQRYASEPLVKVAHSPPSGKSPTILGRQRQELPGFDLVAPRQRGSAPRSPPPTTLTAIGYVNKGDGQVEAILSDEEEVYLVREGEVFAGKYLALKVSGSSVEVVESSPQDVVQPASLGVVSDAGSVQASKPWAATSHSPPVRVVEKAEAGQREKSLAATASDSRGELAGTSGPAPTFMKPLGYVEWADGRFAAIIADEDQVYVVQEGGVFADNRQAVRVSRSSVEVVENVSPPPKQPPLQVAGLEAGQRPASGPRDVASHSPPGASRNPAASQEGAISISQTAPGWAYLVTEHRRSRFDLHGQLSDNRSD
jgi:hypothetical protein